eukprot:RCo005294
MSIEQRVQQFVDEAQKGLNKQTKKEIATLRRFLHRNQDHRFAEKEQTKLFSTVQKYASTYAVVGAGGSSGGAAASEEIRAEALGLLEDALKMPLGVLTTRHKAALLRLYEQCGEASAGRGPSGSADAAAVEYQVLDLSSDGVLSSWRRTR